MRSLSMLLRMAEEMSRASMFHFHDPWRVYRLTAPSWTQFNRLRKEAEATIPKIGKDGYQISIDVDGYKPNELTVKVVDGSVLVEGKFEEQEEGQGFISRHFVRRYPLPEGYEADKAISTLSEDGFLTVSIPKPATIEDTSNERIIPIQQTGPAYLNVKENPPIEEPNDKEKK